MHNISKEDVLYAFTQQKKGKHFLLYTYYRDLYFHQGFTADFIAHKISKDLGVPISIRMINHIQYDIIKSTKKLPPPLPYSHVQEEESKTEKANPETTLLPAGKTNTVTSKTVTTEAELTNRMKKIMKLAEELPEKQAKETQEKWNKSQEDIKSFDA